MQFPKIVAAHRWQTWLLVTALLAVVVTGLLVFDLTRNLRTVIINETTRSLENAVKALSQDRVRALPAPASKEALDLQLKKISYEVLSFYPDVEGGYLIDEDVIGHIFPTYTEPGSVLKQPPLEHAEVLAALKESRRTGNVVHRIRQDQKDLVLVAVLAAPDGRIAAWSLRRIFNFSDSSELQKRLLLVGAMIVSLISIGTVLRLSFNLQQGFRTIRSGLRRLEIDPNHRIPDENPELRPIVQAINKMADNRQKLESELRREDRLRTMGRVVAGIAHEIRNPLNSIRLTIRLVARRLKDNPGVNNEIEMVTGEVDRLDALLKSLLAFRADEESTIQQQPVLPIVERSIALVQPHAQERGVLVRVAERANVEAPVDSDRLQQALINLLLNAIDASQRGGVVDIRMQTAKDRIDIAVEDHGSGLSAEAQQQIFEAFYTTKPGGTGLGLAVSKTLLERMGAAIEAANYEGGAKFTIQLPRETSS
jgi:signal transduction histidine kinase